MEKASEEPVFLLLEILMCNIYQSSGVVLRKDRQY